MSEASHYIFCIEKKLIIFATKSVIDTNLILRGHGLESGNCVTIHLGQSMYKSELP